MKTKPASIRLLCVALMCVFVVMACESTRDDDRNGAPEPGDNVTSMNTCPDECQALHPPGPPTGGPSNSWIQVQASSYGPGGLMISVDVDGPHDEGSAYSNVSNIRVWASTGVRPQNTTTERPDDDDTRVQSPRDYNIVSYRWAGSTIVRRTGAAQVWAYIEVTFNPTTPGDPDGVFSFWEVWDANDPATGWGHPTSY